jgi:hypothetical protein
MDNNPYFTYSSNDTEYTPMVERSPTLVDGNETNGPGGSTPGSQSAVGGRTDMLSSHPHPLKEANGSNSRLGSGLGLEVNGVDASTTSGSEVGNGTSGSTLDSPSQAKTTPMEITRPAEDRDPEVGLGNGTSGNTLDSPPVGLLWGYWLDFCAGLGGMILLAIVMPLVLIRCIVGGSERIVLTRGKKIKAGWITIAILIAIGVGVGVPCGALGKCSHTNDPDVPTPREPKPSPIVEPKPSPIVEPKPPPIVEPTGTPGNIAATRPCQPNFEGLALAVNGSNHVEWGFWGIGGDTVIAQRPNPSVSEFYLPFTGDPVNMYRIQYVPCLSPSAAYISNLQSHQQQSSNN